MSRILDLAPHLIDDLRVPDRLDTSDVFDLMDAMETNGQLVPILLRPHPKAEGRYLLVYGARRLEAVRQSDKLNTVRAVVADLDDDAALNATLSENMARRELTFIERAALIHKLVSCGVSTQTALAEIFTVSRSSVSTAVSIVETLGLPLVHSIGAAGGIGRPRWAALAQRVEASGIDREHLCDVAFRAADRVKVGTDPGPADGGLSPDHAAFEACAAAVAPACVPAGRRFNTSTRHPVIREGTHIGAVRRLPSGEVHLVVAAGPFADWVERSGHETLCKLHRTWRNPAFGEVSEG